MVMIIKTIMVTIITAIIIMVMIIMMKFLLTAEITIVVRAFFIPDNDKNKKWHEE